MRWSGSTESALIDRSRQLSYFVARSTMPANASTAASSTARSAAGLVISPSIDWRERRGTVAVRTNGLIAFFGPRSGVADDPHDIDSSASAQDLQHIVAAHTESWYEHSK